MPRPPKNGVTYSYSWEQEEALMRPTLKALGMTAQAAAYMFERFMEFDSDGG